MLEDAGEGAAVFHEFEQVFVGAPGVPFVVDAVGGVVEGPEVAFGGAAASGAEVVDGGFVDLEVVACQQCLFLQVVEGLEQEGCVVHPVARQGAVAVDSPDPHHLLLPVEGQVPAVFGAGDAGKECGCQDTAFEQTRWQRGDGHAGAFVCFLAAGVFVADVEVAPVAGGLVVELLGDFLADVLPEVGGLGDFVGVGDFAGGGEVLDGFFEPRPLAALAGFWGRLISRRSCLSAAGGAGLFCRFGVEQEFELGGVELLAAGAEDLPGEFADAGAQEFVFLL